MKRKSFEKSRCSIARSLDRAGDWWTILIMRDIFEGLSRFDEIEASLRISPGILSRRMSALVKNGLLRKVPYSKKPLRFCYELTSVGRDFQPVLLALFAWGHRHFAAAKPSTRLIDSRTGIDVDLGLMDKRTGMPITDDVHAFVLGPGADDRIKAKYARLRPFSVPKASKPKPLIKPR
ncbi:helix-turn-helix domain-containing protein [Bradyrhizobium sp.]|uniref:winged helix-turn-helix transcriptional regulator n=1 Tax=Bradyrhizobium sp. TaxID=376 RepID=UPI001DDD9D1B|nr:helix-turn-helix domain-containing protein [Bradyrhizobium sp.]MBI5317915.1 helix-turn-helix transcriptional regulator [Bradyrhizobium sp.]